MTPMLRVVMLSAVGLLVHAPAFCGPTVGFVERWNVLDSTSNWLSQATDTNPNVGGVDGRRRRAWVSLV